MVHFLAFCNDHFHLEDLEWQLVDGMNDTAESPQLMDFAESILNKPGEYWVIGTLFQKTTLQELFFPEGVHYDGKDFKPGLGTSKKISAASITRGFLQHLSNLAPDVTPSWKEIETFLTNIKRLKDAMNGKEKPR